MPLYGVSDLMGRENKTPHRARIYLLIKRISSSDPMLHSDINVEGKVLSLCHELLDALRPSRRHAWTSLHCDFGEMAVWIVSESVSANPGRSRGDIAC